MRLSKRQLSAWSWQRQRRASQRPEIIEALLADLQQARPDHIAITGDLVNFSLPEEFAQAVHWLRRLGRPDEVSVVPGNHDALVPVPAEQGWDQWRPWMSGDEPGDKGWPWLRVRGRIALLGVSSARPTPPGWAGGRVGRRQREALALRLRALRQAGLFRVVLMHHPLAEAAASRRKALADRAEMRALLAREGAELLLHGHAREPQLEQLPAGPLCLGMPSASATASAHDVAARWQLLRIAERDGVWSVERRLRIWHEPAHAFVCGGRYRIALPARAAAVAVAGCIAAAG